MFVSFVAVLFVPLRPPPLRASFASSRDGRRRWLALRRGPTDVHLELKPLYMAPEIMKGGTYDARSDLWSIGAILYQVSAVPLAVLSSCP